MNLIEDLQWRGLIADCTDIAGLGQRLAAGRSRSIAASIRPAIVSMLGI